ncbi:MAG: IMP cyclohydrolase [Lentisphaeria bacterium]|jgi:phosphoribosylaminoimidazolecarboxamide formyltransferase/IMP cyclohydrolase
MSSDTMSRATYLTRNVGDYAAEIEVNGLKFTKVDDLRYGTNPHQTAAYYKPAGHPCAIGDMQLLKSGKGGLSQTNLEDISYALNIVKFFARPACAVMKHVNPSGAAVALPGEDALTVYRKARAADPRAAFGSTTAFNCKVDAATAREIMQLFTECVVAPAYDAAALAVFQDQESFRLNQHIRILQCGDLATLPKYVGDPVAGHRTLKVLADGSLVIADPLLTKVRSVADFAPASGSSKALGTVKAAVAATPRQLDDLLIAWYINLNVRSNGVVIVKDGGTLAVGTGEQDRVGAVEQAVEKCRLKYAGQETLAGAVMASDGFFPMPDGVEVAAKAGVAAIVAPAGSLKDAEVVARANELGVALYHAPERIFSHH